MKISLNWLKNYVDLSDVSVKEIVSKLTMSGLEVEDVINEEEIYKNFVVGFVKEKIKHPNADKLSVCTVSTGEEELQVICGAPNVNAGQKVVFAKVGAVVPKSNFKINKAKIRGVESFGMICSEAELEISDNHEGIMVLDGNLKEGTPVSEALGFNDVVMEIAITPNRSDALSHIGVARDLAALFNSDLKLPEIKLPEAADDIKELASIEIWDTVNCPRYSALVVKDVKIKESPEWLKSRLLSIGLRPINNVVDVTNFVMYETGQPLHAFNLDMLNGNKIVVRSTEIETVFTTLDSKERKLPAGALLICDAQKPVAVAGVMGGENSEISETTGNILIESAHFNPSNIRRTSKAIGLSTEASYRFERTVDPGLTLYSAERAAQLIAQLTGGKIAHGNIDVYPEPIKGKEVRLRFKRVEKLLGYQISEEKIRTILSRLGCKIIYDSEEEIRLLVPTYRSDIEREVDLIEEIARINGYDNIPTISRIAITLEKKYDESEFADRVKDTANSLGFFEMINNPLQGDKAASLIGSKIPVLNPQSLDMAYLRTSLIPGALSVVSNNINIGEKNLALFEIGNVFNKKVNSEISSFDDYDEDQKVLFLLTGMINQKEWYVKEQFYNFYHLKGLINSFLSKILLDNVLNDSYYAGENTLYEFRFDKIHAKSAAGTGGKINKAVLKQFDIQQEVFCFEFNLNLLKQIKSKKEKYTELLKYPKVLRDFAFVFNKSITHEEVTAFIKKHGSELLKSVKLFDLFESESLGKDKKSMAFSLEYYDANRTLTEEEVEKDFLSIISAVTKRFNAILRGN